MSQTVLYEASDATATITLNRPERMNTMGDDLQERAVEALERAASDPAIRAVILTGAGRAFCAGGDLDAMRGRNRAGSSGRASSREQRIAMLRANMRSSELLMTMPKVTLAAINGACAGAGLSLACACDLRYAAAGAKFNVAFRNAGLSGDFGGTWTLPRVVGPGKARELFMRSPRFDANEAARIGLVSAVFPETELLAQVRAIAAELAAAPPLALATIKQNLNDALTSSFAAHLDREAERLIAMSETEDHLEAASAFLEKRAPVFKGR